MVPRSKLNADDDARVTGSGGEMTVPGLYSPPVSDSPSQSHREHKASSPASVRCAVLTISDTRTEATDTGGRAIVTLLSEHGHEVMFKHIVRDEPDQVRALIAGWIGI